jgi:serine/threonine-protein kinase
MRGEIARLQIEHTSPSIRGACNESIDIVCAQRPRRRVRAMLTTQARTRARVAPLSRYRRAMDSTRDSDASIDDADTLAAPAAGGSAVTLKSRPLAARYVLGAGIAKGGMGEVAAARDLDVGRDVAIKRLHAASPGAGEIARFVREARIQGRLDHPAIVPVIDLGTDEDGRPYFTMKRLAGTTLAELLARDDAAAARPRLLRAFADVCLAVEFAHARGVVHRDLKPANIVLGDYGEVYVLDWGVAKVVDAHADADPGASDVGQGVVSLDGMTQVGAVLGTPGYMPPEQVRGETDVDARADVYALGCVLFEVLAGEPLHPRGAAALATTLAGVSDARPSRNGAWVPPELEAACVRATKVEPAERFARARELADAVQRYLDGDRDVQRRRELADAHVAAASEALVAGHGADARALALREAGRALALDPTSAEAAQIVTRLMLDPPAETPPAVLAELAELDRGQMIRQGTLGAASLLGYLLFLPLLWWFGVEDWTWAGAIYATVVVTVAAMWWMSRDPRRIAPPAVAAIVLLNALILFMVSRVLGPYLIVPALAIGAITATSSFPLLRRYYTWVWLAYAIAALAPTGLEELGVLTRTTAFDGGVMTIHSPMMAIGPRLVVLLVGYLALTLYMSGHLARGLAMNAAEAQRRLQVQAWHLKQLVP